MGFGEIWGVMATSSVNAASLIGFRINHPPAGFVPERDLPQGFLEFLTPLHERFAPWQQQLIQDRKRVSSGIAR